MVVLATFTQPTNGIRHRQSNTTVYVNDNNLGKGTLYIAESRLSWVSDSGSGFSIEYPHISLHAVSRDLSSFPQECLFLMLDTALGDEETSSNNENENGSDEQGTTELRLVPDDRGMLDAMFHAMNACQALHPDPEDSFSDEDFYEDADDIPLDDADTQMARLRIESLDRRAYMLDRGMNVEVEGMNLMRDLLRNRQTVWGGVSQHMSDGVGGPLEGMVSNISEDRMENTYENRVRGTLEDRVGGILEDRVGGILEDRVGGILEDRVEGTSEGRVEGTSEGRVEGISESRVEEGNSEDRVEGTSEDRVGDWVGNILASDMAQVDRTYSLDNTWHWGRMAELPVAHSFQTDPEEESNFADAEN